MTVVDVVDVPVLPPAGPQIASLSRLPYWPSASGPDLTRGELLTGLLATVGLLLIGLHANVVLIIEV